MMRCKLKFMCNCHTYFHLLTKTRLSRFVMFGANNDRNTSACKHTYSNNVNYKSFCKHECLVSHYGYSQSAVSNHNGTVNDEINPGGHSLI